MAVDVFDDGGVAVAAAPDFSPVSLCDALTSCLSETVGVLAAAGVAAADVAGLSPVSLRDLSEAADKFAAAAAGVDAAVVSGFSPVFSRLWSQSCLLTAVDVFNAAGVVAAATPETVDVIAAAGVAAAAVAGFSPVSLRELCFDRFFSPCGER